MVIVVPRAQEPGHDFFGGVTTTAVVNCCASPPPQTRPVGDGVITKGVDLRLSFQRGVRNLVCSRRIVKVLK